MKRIVAFLFLLVPFMVFSQAVPTDFRNGISAKFVNLYTATELTISSDTITVTQAVHTVDGQDNLDDDLSTINGYGTVTSVSLYPASADRNITIKHGTGNIVTSNGADYTIPDNGFVNLVYDGSNWRVMSAGGSATYTAKRVLVSDGSGNISASSVTDTTLQYLDATSSVQGQLNNKQTLDTGLTSLAGLSYSEASYVKATAADTFALRTLTETITDLLPDQTGNNGKALTTNGSGTLSWETITPGGAGSDTTAIHDDTAGEISAVTEKAAPVAADLVLIEDSESTNAKKRVQISNLIKPVLPSQSGNAGKYLTTDGTDASWAAVSGGTTADTAWTGTNWSGITAESPSMDKVEDALQEVGISYTYRASELVIGDNGKPVTAYVDITAFDNSTIDAIGDDLVAGWKFSDGALLADDVGSHTLTNGAATANDSSGKSGYCALFDGSNDYLIAADSDSWPNGTGDWAISLWVKRDGTGHDDRLIDQYSTSDTQKAFNLWINTSDHLCFLYGTAVDGSSWANGGDYEDNDSVNTDWHNVIVTRVGTTIYMYLDGSSTKTWSIGSDSIYNSPNPIWMGASHYNSGQYKLDGRLDEVMIWSGSGITSDMATAIYNSGTGRFYDPSSTKDFRPTATLAHEFGGLEADVSAYSGLVKISGGSTSAATIGIADNNIVEIDSADVGTGEYAKFTANGLEGKTASEVKTDLSLNNVENTAISTATTIGTITSGGLGTGATVGGVTMSLGSDTTGDMYYAGGSNVLTRLGIGTDNYLLSSTGSAPQWLSPANVLADLSGVAGSAFSFNSQNLTSVGTIGCGTITSSGNLVIANSGTIGSAGDTDAMAISSGGVVTLSVQGIADNQVLTVDQADAADNDIAKFTANGLEGRSYSELKTDLGLNNVDNVADANQTSLGTVTSGGLGTGATIGGVTMSLGSDADGDIYYRSSNVLTRLPKGVAYAMLMMNSGATAPEWVLKPATISAEVFISEHTDPGATLINTSEENIDDGRESEIRFRGEKDDGSQMMLAKFRASHDGGDDDDKGKWKIMVNDGDDGLTPSVTSISGDSSGNITIPTGNLSVNSTSDTTTAGPYINLYRDRDGGGENGDYIGYASFSANTAGDTGIVEYARIGCSIYSSLNGDEEGKLTLATVNNGSSATSYVSLLNGNIELGKPGTTPSFNMYRNKASTALANDPIGQRLYYGHNDVSPTPEKIVYFQEYITTPDVSDSSEDGKLEWYLRGAGSLALELTLTDGAFAIAGTLSKGGGTFTIDHPLDPENKLLQHSFVESPEMRNLYFGQVQLVNGKAKVILPEWWTALNGTDKKEYNYQLTCIGGFAQLWISKEVENNEFEISGSADIKVSWQLSGIRHDKFAEANRVQVEVDKEEPVLTSETEKVIENGETFIVTKERVTNTMNAKGYYRHPRLYIDKEKINDNYGWKIKSKVKKNLQ